MYAATNYFDDNSMGYDVALTMRQLRLPTFNQGRPTTSSYAEVSGLPSVGFTRATPAPIRVLFGSSPLPVWLRHAVQKVEVILQLEDNWDTYGARPIEAEVAITGLNFLLSVMDPGIPEPSIVPVPDGGIQFEWHKNGKHFEIEIPSSEEISFSFEDDDNHQEIADEGSLHSLKPRVRELLRQVFL